MATLEETWDAQVRNNNASTAGNIAWEAREKQGAVIDRELVDAQVAILRAETTWASRPWWQRQSGMLAIGYALAVAIIVTITAFAVHQLAGENTSVGDLVWQEHSTGTTVKVVPPVATTVTSLNVFGTILSRQAWLAQVGKSTNCPATTSMATGEIGLPLIPIHGKIAFSHTGQNSILTLTGTDMKGNEIYVPTVGQVAFVPQADSYETLLRGHTWVHLGERAIFVCNG